MIGKYIVYSSVTNMNEKKEKTWIYERKHGVPKMVWSKDVVKTSCIYLQLDDDIIRFSILDLTHIVFCIFPMLWYLEMFCFEIIVAFANFLILAAWPGVNRNNLKGQK